MRIAKRLAIAQWDVFTSERLQGNSLAVLFDARGLTDREMQALAREKNLSETTFVFPRPKEVEEKSGVRVRIFTVQEELPFAGHPTLGTAFALRGGSNVQQITLELNVGKVPVRFLDADGGPAYGEMKQMDPVFTTRHDAGMVASALGFSADELDPSLPIETVSTGLPYIIVPFKSLSFLEKLRLDVRRADTYLQGADAKFFYLVSRETVDPGARLHARMLFYNGEDPATGSAAGCAVAWMVAHGISESDEQVLIEQGIEMHRPSRIFVRAARSGNRVVNVFVGGHAVEIMRGEVFL